MNRRDMKAQVKKTLASFLVRHMHDDEGRFDQNIMAEIKLDVFRDGYEGSEAERRRLENIIYEIHREAHQYEV